MKRSLQRMLCSVVALVSIAVMAKSEPENPLSIRGPFYEPRQVASGEPISIRFEVASSQKSQIFTIAQGVLFDKDGNRITEVDEGFRKKLRLFGGRSRSVEFKIRAPALAHPDSFRACLDLLPAKPGEPSYITSNVAAGANAGEYFHVSGAGSTSGHGSGGGGWEQLASSPDLKIERVRLTQSRVAPGQPLQVQVVVANIGAGEAGSCDVALSFDDLPMLALSTRCDSVPSGGRKTMDLTVKPDTRLVRAGRHILKITADNAWELDDQDRANNIAEASFQALPAPFGMIFDREEILLKAIAGQQEPARANLALWSRDEASAEVSCELLMEGVKCAPAHLVIDQNERRIELGTTPDALKLGEHRGILKLKARSADIDGERAFEIPVRLVVSSDTKLRRLRMLTPFVRGEVPGGAARVLLPFEAENIPLDAKLIVHVSPDGERSGQELVSNQASFGSIEVAVPSDLRSAKTYFILSYAANPAIKDVSKFPLNLEARKLVLTNPAPGGTFARGQEIPIRWNVSGEVEYIRCDFRAEQDAAVHSAGVSPSPSEPRWSPIVAAIKASDGQLLWRIPDDLEESLCRIRIMEVGDERVSAEMPQPFRIADIVLTQNTSADPSVENLTATPKEALAEQESILLAGSIKNRGGAMSGVYGLRISVDDQEIKNLSAPRPPLPPNSGGDFSFQLPVQHLHAGANRVRVSVDPGFTSNASLLGVDAKKMKRYDFDASNNEMVVEIRRVIDTPSVPSTGDPNKETPLPADLVIRDFTTEPATPQEGDLIHLKARYGNQGGTNVRHAYVVFKEGSRVLDELSSPNEEHPAPAGSWMMATENYRPSSSGFKTLRAEIVIPDNVLDSDPKNNTRELKIEVRPNAEKVLREILKSMTDAYQQGEIDRFISYYAPGFSGDGSLQEYKARLKQMRALRDDLDLSIAVDVESVDEKENNTATVTYAVTESIRWKTGWDEPILNRRKLRDNFVFQNNRWLCAKREIFE